MSKSNLKYLLKIFFLFIIISYTTDKIVFIILNNISDKVYSGQSIGKLNQYLQIKDSLDMVIFGSSRANHNIDPTQISDNSFNMGVDGRQLAFSSTLIKLLPKQKKQLILLHIDPVNAFSKNYAGNDVDALLNKYNRNKIIAKEIDRLKQNNILQKFYWSLSYNRIFFGILKNYFKPKYDYKNYSGYYPIYPTKGQQKNLKKILKQEKSKDCSEHYEINDIYEYLLDEIQLFCKKNNKNLILFTSPVLSDNCKKDNRLFNEIIKTKGFIYFDFSDLFEQDYSLKYWKDETHLSYIGADIFTQSVRTIVEDNKNKISSTKKH